MIITKMIIIKEKWKNLVVADLEIEKIVVDHKTKKTEKIKINHVITTITITAIIDPNLLKKKYKKILKVNLKADLKK